MSDGELLTELRYHERNFQGLIHGPLCGQAADAIDRITAERDGLRKALATAQWRLDAISSGRCPDAPPGVANDPVRYREWAAFFADVGGREIRAALSTTSPVASTIEGGKEKR